ncbi:MAG: hypothetical protein ACYC35_26370 [Pirellulales bacterium]
MGQHRSFRLTVTSTGDPAEQPSLTARQKYADAIVTALVQHAIVLIFSALILDGGVLLRFCTIAVVASWICTLVILVRRPRQPTDCDIVLVKFGFWPAMCLVFWMWIGLGMLVP